ncbi:hypothetical protein [Nitratireductor luteus]|uniref:hypothetical protein n=1 Tax=Nitratireductor luteus TaxID=2976980 RepID=UPI00223FD4FB|nr:hypothetical protein [Nitratireductor luteus]
MTWTFLTVPALLGLANAVEAACPQALAIYQEVGGQTAIDFIPNMDMVAASNTFRLILPDAAPIEGHVEWQSGGGRPDGLLLKDCPTGDATGEELAACTLWRGVVYAVDDAGDVGLLPGPRDDAAQQLIMTDLSRALHFSTLNDGETALPGFDVYEITGCQE